jgi:hypothetical protein
MVGIGDFFFIALGALLVGIATAMLVNWLIAIPMALGVACISLALCKSQ